MEEASDLERCRDTSRRARMVKGKTSKKIHAAIALTMGCVSAATSPTLHMQHDFAKEEDQPYPPHVGPRAPKGGKSNRSHSRIARRADTGCES